MYYQNHNLIFIYYNFIITMLQEIIFSCKMCGNIIDINDINHAWAHECFLHFDKNKFALAFDDENKLYPGENMNFMQQPLLK